MTKDEREHLDYIIHQKVKKEVDDYRALEHYIKTETRTAAAKVMGVIGAITVGLSVLGYLGRNYIVERITRDALTTVGEHFAHDAAQKLISSQVGGMIERQVPGIIDANVPSMISNKIETTERDIRTRIESQVAQIAKSMHDEAEVVAAKERELERRIGLIPKMVAAQGGMRREYDELRSMLGGTNELAAFVEPTVREIERRYWSKRIRQDDYYLSLRRADGQKNDPDVLVDLIHADLDHNCDGAINELVGLGRKEHVETLVYAVQNSRRLNSVYLAIVGIEKLAGRSFPALGIDDVSRWWEANKTNEIYRGAYERYQPIVERMRARVNVSVATNVVTASGLLGDTVALMNDKPDFMPAAMSVLEQVVYYPVDPMNRFCEGRKEVFERAMELTKQRMRDSDRWWNFKAYYDIFNGNFDNTVTNRLAVSATFENEMKKSGLYNQGLFDNPKYRWPSKMPKPPPKVTPPVPVRPRRIESARFVVSQPVRVPLDSSEAGAVGYVSADIAKGRRQLAELPFAASDTITDTLGTKHAPEVVAGDVMSWKNGDKESSYSFDGKHWKDGTGNNADGVVIPLGRCPIFYERKTDVKTKVGFSGCVK